MDTELERLMIRLVGNNEHYIAKLQQSAAETVTFSKKVEKTLETVAAKARQVGSAMSRYLTAPLMGIGLLGIKAGSAFESGFAGVIKTVEATDAQLEQLRQGFRQLGRSIPVNLVELLHIGEIAGQLGIATDRVLDFTKVIGSLATATNMTAEQGALEMARFANIMGLPQAQFENLASSLVALGNDMATRESEIMSMAMRLAGAGRMVGMTSADVMALAASLSSVGIEAEAGGSAFSTLFMDVTKAVGQSSEVLDTYAKLTGKTVEQFKQSFRTDAVRAVEDLLRSLGALNSEDAASMLDQLGADGKIMTRVLLSSALAVDKFGHAISLSSKSFKENTALAREAQVRFSTFASAVTLLKNEWDLFAESVFQVVRPALMTVIQKTQQIVKWFEGLAPATKVVTVAVAAIAAAVGPVLIGIGVGLNLIQTAIAGIATGLGILGTAASWLFSWPALIGAAGVALGAMVIDLKGLPELWESATTAARGWWESIKGFTQHFKENLAILKAWAIGQWEIISARVSAAWTAARDTVRRVIGSVRVDLQAVAATARDVAGKVLGFFEHLGENLSLIAGWVQRNWFNAVLDISQAGNLLATNFVHNVGVGMDTLVKLTAEAMKATAMLVGEGVKTAIRMFFEMGQSLGEVFKATFNGDMIRWLVAGVTTAAQKVSEFASFITEKIKAAFTGGEGPAVEKFAEQINRGVQQVEPQLDFRARMEKIMREGLDAMRGPLEGFQSHLEKFPELNLEFGGLNLPQFITKQIEEAAKAAEQATAAPEFQNAMKAFEDKEVAVKFAVSGVDAVLAGTTEAMSRIAEFKSMRPSVSQEMTLRQSAPANDMKETNKGVGAAVGILAEIRDHLRDNGGLKIATANIGG